MKLFLLIAVVALADARVLNKNDCTGIPIKGIDHEKVVLKEYVDKPYQLSIDYNTNILYFSYSTHDEDVFKMSYLNLKTNEYGIITGINGPFASAVEDKSHQVYFGGTDGLYKLQPGRAVANRLGVTDLNIWQLFSKNGDIYFTTYPDEKAFVYTHGEVRGVTEILNSNALLIAVDNDNHLIFSNSSGLFARTKTSETSLGDYTVNGFAADIDGKLFFSTPTGIYKIMDSTHNVKKLADIMNIYGIAIESDGSIIYASQNSIIRLQSTGEVCSDDED